VANSWCPNLSPTHRLADHEEVRLADQERALMTDPSADQHPTTEPIRRPGPHWWLWYALGGGIPARYSAWVLHDTTTRTWALRHVARAVVQLAIPIALVLVLVPGAFWIRGMAALGGVMLAMFFSIAYMPETTENRVVRAGYRAGTATAERERASVARAQQDSERKRAAAARRAARYRARTGQ
jgi:hypothetical protein